MISDSYRRLCEEAHAKRESFGNSGQLHAEKVLKFSEMIKSSDILDYGCGKGSLQTQIPFPIKQYDPCIPEHSKRPEPADLVVCTDVLEHIEPEYLADVLDDLKRVTQDSMYLVVSTRRAAKKLSDGRNCHLIVENAQWWLNLLWSRFDIKIYSDRGGGDFEVFAENKWRSRII